MDLETPIEKVPRITSVYQKRLKKLGIKTISDLIFHFPAKYQDFSKITKIKDAKLNETVCLKGKILEIKNRTTFVKRMVLTEALLQDDTGAIKVVWFNQPYLTKNIKQGDTVCLAGKISLGDKGAYLSSPSYERISSKVESGESKVGLKHTGRLVPVYPETERVSSRWLRYILSSLLPKIKNEISEIIPQKTIREHNLLPVKQAIWQIHFPDSIKLAQNAKKRFAFEELFLIELIVLKRKIKTLQKKSFSISINLKVIKEFLDSLPFKLTDAQKKCTWQILKDLEKPRPMSRLLQGDVGSGKTVVAVISALNTVKAGYQVAFMAPTEILAYQHFKKISKILNKFNLKIGLLTGKEARIFSGKRTQKTSRKKLLENLKKGRINILIGTHALIQDKINFSSSPNELALVILDEQHRFGVEQRARLSKDSSKKERSLPHFLSMTATPIPRTLTLTIYGDLDLSLIDELPKGRKKIITKVIPPKNRKQAYDFIRNEVKKGRQVFVICPRIEPSEKEKQDFLGWTDVKAVKQEYEKLSETVFPDLSVGMLHGKMKPKEKEEKMQDFKNKKIDIMVSTSVIEVGIDIPNATVIMIEGAERFGLAQLHQFRGRVGRAKHQSYCLLFTDSPFKKVNQRLSALVKCENGFELAEKDLKIRGPGDFLGKRQSGIPDFAMSALKNLSLVEKTRQAAMQVLTEDIELKKYPSLRDRLSQFKQKVHLE